MAQPDRQGRNRRRAGEVDLTRALHLVDLENLIGDPFADQAACRGALLGFLDAAAWCPGDHVVVAANPWMVGRLAWDTPVPCRLLIGHGRDGADRALLADADPAFVAGRFGRTVVGSGDHIFTDLVVGLRARGCRVELVSRRDGLSRRLAAAVDAYRWLPQPWPSPPLGDPGRSAA